MEGQEIHVIREVYTRLATFRILDLPAELQDRIYEFSVEREVDFLLTTIEDLDPRLTLPNLTSFKYLSYKSISNEDNNSNDEGVEDPDEKEDQVLGFTITFSTPLLLVSRRVNNDVRNLLKIKRRQYHEVFKSTFYRNRIVSPSPLFLEICSQSRFIFTSYGRSTMRFLRNIPPEMRKNVRNIIIRQSNLLGTPRELAGIYNSIVEIHASAFTNLLGELFPTIVTIAIELPNSLEESAFYHNDLLGNVCGMLAESKVDIVRLHHPYFNREGNNYYKNYHVEYMMQGIENEAAVLSAAGNERVSKMLNGVLEVRGDNSRNSRGILGAQDSVKITRRTDVEVESPSQSNADVPSWH
ncbi:hypothetical protein K505DRAFT_355167 [Melanomma pulvis-pyrius CBS 109.77]|uniref:Uncharacterized protein n=1 Tax=Melanomma pulvis-pyrius CBS 109.77 TaxID=1314802 RepID=A0A6A6XXI0_9PLEO|nr:hypothetical protein K505DRAFT_355167 [Melanomma pulvis-pyrius CBS 109.77]